MDLIYNFVEKHDKLARLLQMKVEAAEPGYARVTMPLADNHRNGMGVAHGGVIFSLADVAFGVASNAGRKRGVVSMSASIEFLRPCRKGPLTAEARSVRIGDHVVNFDVLVYDGDDQLIARAISCGYVTDVILSE